MKKLYILTITQTMAASEQLKLSADNFDVSRLFLEKPVKNEKRKNVFSAKLRYLNDDDERSFFLLQTPRLFTPFGANSYNDDDKYVLTFTLGDDGKEGKFRALLDSIEERVKELIKELPRTYHKDFTKLVRPSKEPEKYKPTFSVKLKTNQETGELFADVYNKKQEQLVINLENISKELPKRSKVRGLLMLNSVWFVNKNCGVTVNAKQLMVYPTQDKGCMFGDVSDSDGEEDGDGDGEAGELEESDNESE